MATRTSALIVALIVSLSVTSYAQSRDEDDATSLYLLALSDSRLSGRVAETDVLVLRRRTISPRMIFVVPTTDPLTRLAFAGEDTARHFLQMEAEVDLVRMNGGFANVRFIESSELERLKAAGPSNWARFQKRYGSTAKLIYLSRIARNDADTTALLYVHSACGPLCGTGHFVSFKREAGVWRIDRIELFSQA